MLEARPLRLTEIAYEWCSTIYENRKTIVGWENLLLICLELGFRHLNPSNSCTNVRLTLAHTKHHWGLVDVVFKSQKSEAIADFLHALTTKSSLPHRADEMIGICVGHLFGLHTLGPFSPRLRQLVIRFVGRAGYDGFKSAGVEKLVELLDHLHVTVEEIDQTYLWMLLLLGVIRSPEGGQRLSNWYWESLVELAIRGAWFIFGDTDVLKIAKTLIDAQEWGKLECWVGIVWTAFGGEIAIEWILGETAEGMSPEPERITITEEGLEHSMLLLFRHRPGAAQRLEQWIERWSEQCAWNRIPQSFRRILTRAHGAVQRQDAP